MKLKHLLLFSIFMALFSCNTESIDDPDTETEDLILLKKTIETDSDGEVYITNYTYDGNKLISVDYGDDSKNVYTYDNNDKLVKDEFFREGELAAYVILEYNSEGKVSTFFETFLEDSGISERDYKHLITYNTDGSLTDEVYVSFSNSEFELDYTETITFNEKNILNVDTSSDSMSYLYDDKNGVFKNVHAIEVLNILAENEFGALIYGNTNNATNIKYEYSSFVYTETYEFSYDDNNYPKTADYKEDANGTLQSQLTIEYFYE